MSDHKRPLGIDVLAAARGRIADALSACERAYVSFSGGKDSSVMLDLVAEEARKRNRRIGVLFIDLEGQYKLTIDYIAETLTRHADVADPYWVALPLNLRNAVSQYDPHWTCWDPGRRSDWIRTPPDEAIVDESLFPFFRRGMEFEDFVPQFGEWYSRGERTVCFVGIRTQESLNRWRTIASGTKKRLRRWPWTTKVPKTSKLYNAYPIYDWRTEDIWTYHAKTGMPANGVYDLMHRAGLTIHQARICQPYGDDQRKGLWLFHLLEPATWARVVARVNGANQGALYARTTGNIMGVGRVTLPDGQTWQSFSEQILASMPAPTAAHYRIKIGVFLRWWAHRGYAGGIPDEGEPREEADRSVPSWRRICKALLRNDYWCKGLSFSQQKDTAAYVRYTQIMKRRFSGGGEYGEAWEREVGYCPEGTPSPKQLALLAALTGGSTVHQAWRALAKAMCVSIRHAQKYATSKDASEAIDRLKTADAEWRAETYGMAAHERGDRCSTLVGERHKQWQ